MAQQEETKQREALEAKISILAEKLAASMGMEVVLVEVRGSGSRTIVRTFIDQPGGISLDDCGSFSRRFSVLLDVEDWIQHGYTLEVSSPGLDRPLAKEEDFRRFSGKGIKIRTRAPLQGQRNFKGRILGVDGGRVRVELAPGRQVEIALPDIEKANLLIEI